MLKCKIELQDMLYKSFFIPCSSCKMKMVCDEIVKKYKVEEY